MKFRLIFHGVQGVPSSNLGAPTSFKSPPAKLLWSHFWSHALASGTQRGPEVCVGLPLNNPPARAHRRASLGASSYGRRESGSFDFSGPLFTCERRRASSQAWISSRGQPITRSVIAIGVGKSASRRNRQKVGLLILSHRQTSAIRTNGVAGTSAVASFER